MDLCPHFPFVKSLLIIITISDYIFKTNTKAAWHALTQAST